MKFDMHCHTKVGSIDAKVPLERYIEILKEKNFDGMLVTDHDSYKGYINWFRAGGMKQAKALDFTVLCGVEYDTKDAGHFIVILPDGLMPRVLKLRGMPVERLIKLVHMLGGVLGPAHPYGAKSSSAMFFKKLKECPEIMEKVDFIEGFNTCETARSNDLAVKLARKYDKPCIGGSDAHVEKYVGMGFTEIQWRPHAGNRQDNGREFSAESRKQADSGHEQLASDREQLAAGREQLTAGHERTAANIEHSATIEEKRISCNNDLIHAIKAGGILGCGGIVREQTAKAKHKEAFYSVLGFRVYNRGLGLLFTPVIRIKLNHL